MIHSVSSYGPGAAGPRVRMINWFDYLNVVPEYHQYAGLPNNRPLSLIRAAPRVACAEHYAHRLDLSGTQLILSREASPFGRGSLEERYLRQAGHGVYDFDDALFHDTSPVRRALGQRDKCRRSVAAADVVIAGNDYLANWAAGINADVRLIPSCVDPASYTPKNDWSIANSRPSLVWLGSPSTEHYVAQISGPLLEVQRQTGAELVIISSPATSEPLASLRGMVRRIPWKLGEFARVLAGADLAIAPLDDSLYSRGKCAFKLLQYAATGLPIVGSPIGANALALGRFDSISAYVVSDWRDAILEILNESATRRELRGRSGMSGVVEHYSFARWAGEWSNAMGI